MRLKDKYPVITVEWADHWIDHGEHVLKDILKNLEPYVGSYSGHLVGESKQMVAICANVWYGEEDEENFSDPMYIMKRAIVYRSDKDDRKPTKRNSAKRVQNSGQRDLEQSRSGQDQAGSSTEDS